MDSKQFQKILKGIVIFIFGLLDTILLIRMLLRLIGASEQSAFVRFWYSLSNPLYAPFHGTMLDFSSEQLVLEINSIIAIIIYFLLAIFFLKVIVGVFLPKVPHKLRSLIDTSFKVTEVILGLRLLFKLVGASTSGFITFLYGISYPFYAPFQGLLKPIGQGNVVFETSTFVAVIIIVILDYVSDKLLTEIFKEGKESKIETGAMPPTQPQTPEAPQTPQTQPTTQGQAVGQPPVTQQPQQSQQQPYQQVPSGQ